MMCPCTRRIFSLATPSWQPLSFHHPTSRIQKQMTEAFPGTRHDAGGSCSLRLLKELDWIWWTTLKRRWIIYWILDIFGGKGFAELCDHCLLPNVFNHIDGMASFRSSFRWSICSVSGYKTGWSAAFLFPTALDHFFSKFLSKRMTTWNYTLNFLKR